MSAIDEKFCCPDVEKSVLGLMLYSKTSLLVAMDKLREEDFSDPVFRVIFKTMHSMHAEGKSVDLVLLATRLKDLNKLDQIGGIVFLTSLIQCVDTIAYLDDYCEVIKKKSTIRQIKDGITRSSRILHDEEDVDEILDQIRQIFFEIGISNEGSMPLKDILMDNSQENLTTRKSDFDQGILPALDGIPSLWKNLDDLIECLGNSHLIILAARPSIGKTTFALNLAYNICYKQKVSAGFFSFEMTSQQLALKLLVSHCHVEPKKITTGNLNSQELTLACQGVNELSTANLIIDDHPVHKFSEMKAKARRMVESEGVKIIFIDHLQLIKMGGARMDRYAETTEISRELKLMAKELKVPIVVLCQLSRKVDERPGHKPIMSDLRDSGSIEQDSDVILLMHRRDYYDPYDRPGIMELYVAKNRHGSVGTVNFSFEKEFSRFEPLEIQML